MAASGLVAMGVPVHAATTTVAYVANYYSDTVSVIDTDANSVIATIPTGRRPLGVTVNPAATTAYVTNHYSDTVSVIDTATNAVTTTIPTDDGPYEVAVNPAGTTAYVANTNSDTVSVIDTATNAVTTTIPVGSAPRGVVVNPAGTTVYVTNQYSHSVSVINTTTNIVTATIPMGSRPYDMAMNPIGTVIYVTNPYSNTVSVIDTATNAVVSTISSSDHPCGVAVHPTGAMAYVTNHHSDSVSVIDTATNAITTTIRTGDHPIEVAVNPGGTAVHVTNGVSHTVSVIDPVTNAVTATIPTDEGPWGVVAFDLVVPSQPAITGVSPANGPITGGTTVTITGTDLTDATSVLFGSAPATSFSVTTDTRITATVPATSTVGPVHITVTTPNGTSPTGEASQYTYVYPFNGFFRPVDNPPAVNAMKAGRAVPVKFGLSGNHGPDIFATGSPVSRQVDCATGDTLSGEEATEAGSSGLTYKTATDTYTYVWKTDRAWANTCRGLHVKLADGTDHTVNFRFK